MNLNSAEIDPLATYDYQAYASYAPTAISSNVSAYQSSGEPYHNYGVKSESFLYHTNYVNSHNNEATSKSSENKSNVTGNITNVSINKLNENPSDVKENTAEHLNKNKEPPPRKRIKKERKNGQRTNCLSEKIADSDFPFYGCAVCNISFKLLADLDRHIATHKDRITSYGLRIKNQIKKKKLRKEQKKLKKLKKLKKVKNENQVKMEIEIKPENGYIGDTKAEEYKQDLNERNSYQYPSAEVKGENKAGENQLDFKSPSECKENESKEKTKETKDNTDYNLEKMFKCFACQKQFTLSYYLKLHVRSHTGMNTSSHTHTISHSIYIMLCREFLSAKIALT